MDIDYKPLWKLLIDRGMTRSELRILAGISTRALARMGKNENVSTEVLGKICKALHCEITEVMEFVDEDGSQRNKEKEKCGGGRYDKGFSL